MEEVQWIPIEEMRGMEESPLINTAVTIVAGQSYQGVLKSMGKVLWETEYMNNLKWSSSRHLLIIEGKIAIAQWRNMEDNTLPKTQVSITPKTHVGAKFQRIWCTENGTASLPCSSRPERTNSGQSRANIRQPKMGNVPQNNCPLLFISVKLVKTTERWRKCHRLEEPKEAWQLHAG